MADYTPNSWANGRQGGTPITAERLNKMEAGIDAAMVAGQPRSYLHNFTADKFRKASAAMARVRNGEGDMRLLCAGDSTTAGAKASTAATYAGLKAYPRRLAEMLNSYVIPAAPGLVTPRGTSSAMTADTRWTAGTGWVQAGWQNAFVGFGGKGAHFTGTGATAGALVFQDPGILADTFDVYYRRAPSSGSAGTFSVQATGGSAATVDAALVGGAPRIAKATVTAGSAATTNSVTITGLTAGKNVEIVGIEPRLSTVKKVLVGNAGISGSTTVDWVTFSSNSTANDFGGLGSIKAYAPDLTIIDLGINDANALSSSASDYIARLQQIIAAALVTGDVILKTMMPSVESVYPHVVPLEVQYVEAIKGLGLPVIDYYSRTQPGSDYLAAGMMNSDGLHGSDLGYLDVATTVLEALRSF